MGEKNENVFSLIMIVGLPGTGKTTFAKALQQHMGVKHLNSDMIREELGLRGRYTKEDKSKVYHELLNRTGNYLRNGKSVIVDATLYLEELRVPYRRLAGAVGCQVHWVEMKANPETIIKRTAEKRRYSEADFSIYEQIKRVYEPLEDEHLVLDTDGLPLESLIDLVTVFVTRGRASSPKGPAASRPPKTPPERDNTTL